MENQIVKSITLLTMIFLPATFLSVRFANASIILQTHSLLFQALFSTTFFSFEADGWRFSRMFWVYWAVTVPLTAIMVFSWWKWLGGSVKEVRSRLLGK